MIGWARARRRAWRARSRHAQVEASTRWTLLAVPWIMACAGLPQALFTALDGPVPLALTAAAAACAAAMCAVSTLALARGLRSYLGDGPVPRTELITLAVLLTALTAVSGALVVSTGADDRVAASALLFTGATAFLCPFTLVAPLVRVWQVLGALLAVVALTLGLAGMGWQELLGVGTLLVIGAAAVVLTARCSGWYLAVLRELDVARDAQARLAVAEERLRFGRDMHDVVGRNLSVIALKSELAVQLVRRGSEAAVDQMVEVQRLARDSQREVRDVVRGYREADLRTELAGARGVLEAAGISCRTHGTGDGRPGEDSTAGGRRDAAEELPDAVRAALGWVVREGTTNVLRHADATHCTVTLRAGPPAVLTMENDGVRAGAPGDDTPRGSGLDGLRERLSVLGGTLHTGHLAGDRFRLTAEIPLPDGTARGARTVGAAAGTAGSVRATATGQAAGPGEPAATGEPGAATVRPGTGARPGGGPDDGTGGGPAAEDGVDEEPGAARGGAR
ncbi:sensor histidine kinase [Streptomyces sp. JJ36]|uniref:sensor histidine kinase n=1 Tax=Streptomyces sp. JJ36 TaxID=2736645 RepID=UPI001F377C77|nr:sensor histidine kinase [Streptomyces sp. JJ36]MCF6523592.1 sensor histidine kinase [Streptomyces sp. JJ36]